MDDFLGMGIGMEMCEDCHVNPATIHLTHVENNEAQTYHLCEDCARERGIPFPDSETLLRGLEALLSNNSDGGIGDVFGDALGNALVKVTVKQAGGNKKPSRPRVEQQVEDVKCSNCGLKLSEMRSSGCLGCAECYAAFEEHIERILFQVHGAGGHRGKRYGRERTGARRASGANKKELERLRRELDAAIRHEDFERAAAIRDTMRGIDGGAKAK